MFTPMALTFSFALIGAMMLCLTYVPVMSALVLKPTKPSENSISQRLISFINSFYEPSILWALRYKKIVIGSSLALLILSGVLFARMGAEFVPTLDEGDFVIQPVLPTGMSLGKTIETTTKIEQILLENFPEVAQVVTRIGAAEIPTDPMSMEETDVIIKLKPKDTWESAESKDELAEKFKEALQNEMADIEIEFTQPIEMRFNELITGVRADVAIKLFGEDLNILASKAQEIKTLISHVEGASDIVVEKTEGLPQMRVTFDRQKIARYGLNIADLNRVVSMGFAGEAVGSVFEGEKRFDLVLRFNQSQRKSIDDLKYLWVDTPSGDKIPLNELANIEYTTGPAKISRDNTKRRTVVGVNVRDRDLQSVVNDIQEILDNNLNLPSGYLVTYGGQFENLNQAKSRLLVAVPIALFLIFILLFFAFGSIKDVLIVYSAIPLAAVGGILLLWLRGMPFSISAGIGFIALFGIAVLNGIVLIEHFKDLKSKGFANIEQLIVEGTKDRLRPVLLTASAAALGFLPMAISTNAGAEVQRPLATVVVGGLITATILTLIVLPVLYSWSHNFKFKLMKPKVGISILFLISSVFSYAQQTQELSVEEVYKLALERNSSVKASQLYVEKSKTAINTVAFFDKTNLYYGYDENNLAINERPISVFGVSQDFKFPTNYLAERQLKKQEYQVELSKYELRVQELKQDVYSAYYQLNYHEIKAEMYKFLDSLYTDFSKSAKRRFELGDTNYLESITAQSKHRQISTSYKQALQQVRYSQEQLKKLIFVDSIVISTGAQPLEELALKPLEINNHLGTEYMATMVDLEKSKTNLERHKLLPDLSAEYFQGSNTGLNQNLIGYQFGLKIPLLFSGQRKKIKEAQLNYEAMEQEEMAYKTNLETKYNSLMAQLLQYKEVINYYNTEGKALSEQIIATANRSHKEGEIDFFQYIQSIETAQNLQLDYLEHLNNYNQTLIQLNYLML
jgi:cobalt-zinc-cadmium resistance protein CzcA